MPCGRSIGALISVYNRKQVIGIDDNDFCSDGGGYQWQDHCCHLGI